MTDAVRRGRRTLVLLAVVFLGPMAVAMGLYFSGFQWRPQATTEHGSLYQPARPVPWLAPEKWPGADREGTSPPRWKLIHIGPGDCPASCRQALIATRQVRRALGRDLDRVERLYVVTEGVADAAFLAAEHPGIRVISSGAEVAELVKIAGWATEGEIFLADPLGNLVLRYSVGTPMKDMHADLQRLLKVSTIG
jgi:hypothetical protein